MLATVRIGMAQSAPLGPSGKAGPNESSFGQGRVDGMPFPHLVPGPSPGHQEHLGDEGLPPGLMGRLRRLLSMHPYPAYS